MHHAHRAASAPALRLSANARLVMHVTLSRAARTPVPVRAARARAARAPSWAPLCRAITCLISSLAVVDLLWLTWLTCDSYGSSSAACVPVSSNYGYPLLCRSPLQQGDDLCIYGYATSGISIGFSLLLMISVCFKCNCWMYVELWIDWIVVTAGWLLWVVAGIVVSYYNTVGRGFFTLCHSASLCVMICTKHGGW